MLELTLFSMDKKLQNVNLTMRLHYSSDNCVLISEYEAEFIFGSKCIKCDNTVNIHTCSVHQL